MAENNTGHDDAAQGEPPASPASESRAKTPAAQRALAEADARRRDRESGHADISDQGRPREMGGREGPDPVRYGDWENKGIASDF